MSSYKGTYNSWRGGADREWGHFPLHHHPLLLVWVPALRQNIMGLLVSSLWSLRQPDSFFKSLKESSYTSSLTDRSSSSLDTRGTTPTNRFSALSARLKEPIDRPSTTSNTASSYGTGKSSLSTSDRFSKDKPSSLSSYGVGGSAVNSLTSRFGPNSASSGTTSSNTTTEPANSGTFRPSGTSGYIRSGRDTETQRFRGSNSFLDETDRDSKNATNPNNPRETKRLSGSTLSLGSTGTSKEHPWQVKELKEEQRKEKEKEGTPPVQNKLTASTGLGDRDRDRERATGNSAGTGSSSSSSGSTLLTTGSPSGLSSYKPYTPRTLLSTEIKPLTAPTSSSSLRASARFGLKSGTSLTHYSASLPTASTLKAAAILTEEAKKQLSKNHYQYHKEKQEQYREIEEVTSWTSRGTCTILDTADDDTDMAADDISLDEETSFSPRTFNPRYEGVLKHKGVQTEEEPKSKYAGLTSIPRPPLGLGFSSPFTAVMNRFNAEKAAKANASGGDSPNATGVPPPTSTPGFDLINRRGSLKKVSNSSESGNNSKDLKTGKSVSYTPSNSTDQSSRSSLPSRQTSPASRRNSFSNKSRADGEDVVTNNCKNNSEATVTAAAASTKKLPTKASSPPATTTLNAGGLVVNLANKEYVRKSVLNVGETKEDEERKQEGETSRVTKSAMTSNDTRDEDNERSSNNTRSALLSGGNKRDSTRRPPTDPNKSSNNSTTNQQVNRSISRISSQYNLNNNSSSANSSRASSPSPAGNAVTGNNSGTNSAAGAPSVLQRIKSVKNVNPLRKLSLENSAASDSDSSVTSSGRGIGATFAKLKKKLIGGGDNAASGTTTESNNNNSVSTNNNISNNAPNLVEKKGIVRRASAAGSGGGTTSSSTASSRSGSVERSQNASASAVSNPPSSLKKGLSKSETKSSLRTSPSSTSSSDSERKKKGSVSIQTPEEAEAKALSNSELPYNMVQQQEDDGTEEPKQTPFFLRMMSDTPWVRKCQSGEIPWWMASSNSDVPGALGRNSSRSVIKVPTTKDIVEEIAANHPIITSKPNMDDDDSSSELSDIECDDDALDKMTRPLGERTSPDGREIPAMGLVDGMPKGETPFIGTLRNIDDILGFLPANLLAPSPSPAPPTPTPASAALQEAMDELVEAQRKLQLVGQAANDDDDSDSESSSSELSEPDPFDIKPKDADEEDSESSSDEEDDRSTGTSSSFEEVDPASITIPVPARARSQSLASTSQKSDGKSKQTAIENMEAALDTSGLIPQSQREQ
ncbi:hypothetical protein Ocin01_13042, partial [Orchesella cincta]